ncbi:MAG: hypothetical protein ACRDH9_08890 [Actinomycetota bacterium]
MKIAARMSRLIPLLVAFAVLTPSAASAHLEIEGTVVPGTPFTWDGTRAVAVNITGFNNNNVATCGEAPDNYCEYAHVRFDLPFPAGSTALTYKKNANVTIDQFDPASATDFDLHVFASDAEGTELDQIGESAQQITDPLDRPETVQWQLQSKRTYNPDGTVKTEDITTYVLVQVVYFFCPNSMYKGTAKIL